MKTKSPFSKPEPTEAPRRKILLWGPTGTGKTRTALGFPKPAVIDLERGTSFYASEFDFEVLPPASPDDIMRAVKWLRDNRHDFKTLVIDPISVYWAALQRKWSDIFLARLSNRPGFKHEFFELGPREWSTIKSEFAELVSVLMQLDMNVVVVAHDKVTYDATGSFMKAVGSGPDTEKNMDRMFDVVIRCERVDTPQDPSKPRVAAKFVGHTIKDRSNRLPESFPLSAETIADALGRDDLERAAVPRVVASPETVSMIHQCVETLDLSDDKVRSGLERYGVKTFDDLKPKEALEVLCRLRNLVAKKNEPDAAVASAEINEEQPRREDAPCQE